MLRQGSRVIKLVMSQNYDGETVFLANMALNSIIVQDIKKDLKYLGVNIQTLQQKSVLISGDLKEDEVQ